LNFDSHRRHPGSARRPETWFQATVGATYTDPANPGAAWWSPAPRGGPAHHDRLGPRAWPWGAHLVPM